MSRPNFFHLLELDYNIDSKEQIQKKIALKQSEWSKFLNVPGKGTEARANLERLKEIKVIMLDPEKRREEAAQAKKIETEEKVARERKIYTELDQAIGIISKKGWVENVEIQSMSKLFNLSTTEIESRISFPIESRVVKSSQQQRKKVNTAKAKEISENCAALGIQSTHVSGIASLYDYLHVSPTASIEVLIQAADEKYQQIITKRRSAENNIEKNLQADSKSIFQRRREEYDRELTQLRLEEMKHFLKIASASKTIQPSVMEQLIVKAMSLGDLRQTEARTYIEDFCSKNNIEITNPNEENESISWKRCHCCGLINTDNHIHCSNCGLHLTTACPVCNQTATSFTNACGSCGFQIGNMANVRNQLKKAKSHLRENQVGEAVKRFEEIIEWWPNHQEANDYLSLIAKQQKENENTISTIHQLVRKKDYYTARKMFIKERQLVQSSLSLQSMEREALQQIHLAENYIKQAENVTDEALQMDYYIQAIDSATDCQKAIDMLATRPPAAPSNLQIETGSAVISLKWTASNAKGHITYRVLRKEENARARSTGWEVLQETTATSFSDDSAVGGSPYSYRIYALRGSIVSQDYLHTEPLMRKAEIEDLAINQTDNQIELTWTSPVNATSVEVWRKNGSTPQHREDGKLIAQGGLDSVVDSDVTYGNSYGYLLVAQYQTTDKTLYSEGTPCLYKFISAPTMPKNVISKRQDHGISLSWEVTGLTTDHLSLYYAYTPFSNQKNSSIELDQLAHLGDQLTVPAQQAQAFIEIAMNRTVYILPVIHNDEIAIIGKMIVSKDHPEVGNIRHNVIDDDLLIHWNWPPNIQKVLITCNDNAFPTSTKNGMTLDKETYRKFNGYPIQLEKRDYYFTIFTQYEEHNEIVHSNGMPYLFINSPPATLTYEIKIQGFLRKKISLHISCDEAIPIPDLVLVKKDGSIPTHKEQGEVFYKIPAQQPKHTHQFEIPIEFMSVDTYAKLFLADEQYAQKFRIQAVQGKESMKLW